MKIVLVGVFDNPGSTNIFQKIAFENLGCEVIEYNYREIASKLNGYPAMGDDLVSVSEKEKPDLVFLSKVNHLPPEVIDRLNKFTKTWYWFQDAPKVVNQIRADEFVKRATFASAKNYEVIEVFHKLNNNTVFIFEGINENVYKDFCRDRIVDVCFVGERSEWRNNYIEYLEKEGISINLFGPGWDGGPLYNEKVADEYNRAKIALNFSKSIDYHNNVSDRVIQVMACGAMLLTEYCEEIEKLFSRRIHLDWATSKEEMAKLIKFYLKNNRRRETIASTGKDFAYENYTWKKVLEHVVRIAS
jgi:spore maturation protein CgeB